MYEADGMDAGAGPAGRRRRDAPPDEALAVHARAELGVDPGEPAVAVAAAASSLVCFLFGALLPVLPWLFDVPARRRRSAPS